MDKDYVVIARFDDETGEKLKSLRKRLLEKGYINALEVYSYPMELVQRFELKK